MAVGSAVRTIRITVRTADPTILIVSRCVITLAMTEPSDPKLTPPEIPADWLAEFEAAARRPLQTRMRYAFVQTYKPVLDDARYRSFDTMEDYRRWCEQNLPDWLGYGRI